MARTFATFLALLALAGAAQGQTVPISNLPSATTLAGTEPIPAVQGGATVKTNPNAIVTLASATLQPKDADLTAIAALSTQPFGRSLLTSSDAAASRATLGVTATGADTSYLWRSNNLSDLASATNARSNLGLGTLATQSGTFSGTSSGTNTGDQTSVTGNAGTATKLATARNINGVAFDGTASITINAVDSTARAAAGANSDITSLTGLTTPLPISEGGTGATSAATARTALQVARETVFVAGSGGSVTGTTTETVLATITIPAGAIGPNGTVEVIALWSEPNSANSKTLRIAFGGTTIYQQAATTVVATQGYARISNRNSQTAQIAPLGSSAGLGNFTTMVTTAIDTTATVNVTITGQLANTGETIGLESYLVRVTYGA